MKNITQEELNNKIQLHKEWLKDINKGKRLVLNGYDLSNLSLVDVNLKYVDLSGSNLSYVNFFNSNLKYADLGNTNLFSADLRYANLNVAYLHNSNLSYTDLENAILIDSNMSGSNLSYADLRYANLLTANLRNCRLDNTKLSQANINQVYGLDIYSIDNIGTFHGKVTYLPSINTVFAGCWEGNLDEFLEKGLEMNKENIKETKNIKNAYKFFHDMSMVYEFRNYDFY